LRRCCCRSELRGIDFDWRRIEPQQGKFSWEGLDRVVELAKQYGLNLAPMLLYTPRWASTASFAPLDYQLAPPNRYEDYRDFVYAVVSRYKPYGKSPLTADGYGIADWVIWNEPNTHLSGEPLNPDDFWIGSLEEYIQLLRAGYEGAHAADPGSNVLNGALADVYWTPDQSDIVSALARLYDPDGDGNASDGGRPFFDTLNVHLYQLDAPDPAWYQERLDGLLMVMQRFGDEQKPVWITETGYGSLKEQPISVPYISETTQADAVHMLYETCCAFSQVERVFWWSLRDYYVNASDDNPAMEAHYGLIRANFVPKPAYFAYAQMTGYGDKTLSLSAVATIKERPGLLFRLLLSLGLGCM
jgi:GH35 family endo-1,4-beta-xylanase